MPLQPWYHEGLKFRCTCCGRCCTGDPGYVWVNRSETKALAQSLGLTPLEFEKAFLRSVGHRKSLIELPNGDCVFFDRQSRRCRVYPYRPRQCRSWPFWESNLRSPQDWQRTCQRCPGSGTGPTVPLDEIVALLQIIHM